jgi:hypothetical protein
MGIDHQLSPEENADDVASHLIDELLDPEIPHSGFLGMGLCVAKERMFYLRNR